MSDPEWTIIVVIDALNYGIRAGALQCIGTAWFSAWSHSWDLETELWIWNMAQSVRRICNRVSYCKDRLEGILGVHYRCSGTRLEHSQHDLDV